MTFDPCQPCVKLRLIWMDQRPVLVQGLMLAGWLASERVSQLAGYEYGRTRGRQADE